MVKYNKEEVFLIVSEVNMLLYHGSNLVVSSPRLVEQNRFLDFGPGFYTTSNKHQVISFAQKVSIRRRSGEPTVSVYRFNEKKAFAECSVLTFNNANEEWLDFVSDNRVGKYLEMQYDIIYGPVADDDVYRTFALYTANLLTKEQTVERLKIKKLFNQMVFSTDKALTYLEFTGTIDREVK